MTTNRKHMRTRLLVAATAAAAVLGVPTAAHAAVTATTTPTGVAIVGDDLDNTITVTDSAALLAHNLPTGAGTFNSATDWDAALAGDQTVPANGTAVASVLGAGGNDALTVTATVLRAEIDGGTGNDIITGSSNADVLTGGDGDDRVIGARGGDGMKGGAGNDQLVWNNGDGSDVMDGEAGADEIEVNGSTTAGDSFTIKPDAVAPRVRFDRINLVAFNLDIGTSERVTVNGLGGDDVINAGLLGGLAPLTLLTLSGGVGSDAITGGDGADLLLGGDAADTMTGGAGDDRIVGDRGNDAMAGSAGDDTLVWNNGDGSDTMDGQDDSDRVEVNGSVTGGDTFTLAPNGARAKFDRTNLVPFTLDIGTSEALHVNGFGGDDTFTPAAGTAALLRTLELDGGSGNDSLTGGDSADVITGASGNDVLTGGGGLDSVDGGSGNDSVLLRDGGADIGTGGAGTDSAQADRPGVDALAEFETVDQATAIRPLQILSTNVNVKKGYVSLRVACPAGIDGGCRGTIRVTSAAPIRFGKLHVLITLGSARVTLAPGQTAVVRIKLAPGYRLLGRKYISVRATAIVSDAAGISSESSRKLRVGF